VFLLEIEKGMILTILSFVSELEMCIAPVNLKENPLLKLGQKYNAFEKVFCRPLQDDSINELKPNLRDLSRGSNMIGST